MATKNTYFIAANKSASVTDTNSDTIYSFDTTGGAEHLTLGAGSKGTVVGFQGGGEEIKLTQVAQSYVLTTSGATVTVTNTLDGTNFAFTVGTTAGTLTFANGDTRSIGIVGGQVVLTPTGGAGQPITSGGTTPTAGPSTYSIAAADTLVQHAEGNLITYIVTRTAAAGATPFPAETLTFSVAGNTNGGTLPAATAGTDFTVGSSDVTFAAGSNTGTFQVQLNNDLVVEGLEAYQIQLFRGLGVAATLTQTIADATNANNIGQTFTLTTGIDTMPGLIGSGGSTDTGRDDTIVATQATLTALDNLNAGLGLNDKLQVSDTVGTTGGAANFANSTLTNIEQIDYVTVGGFKGDNLDLTLTTSPLTVQNIVTGLLRLNVVMNSSSGTAQQITTNAVDSSGTALTNENITQSGTDGLNIVGGGGILVVNANAATGNINVGKDAGAKDNAFTAATITGGNGVDIRDNVGTAVLTSVTLNSVGGGAAGTGAIRLNSAVLGTVNVNTLVGEHDLTVDDGGATLALNLTGVSKGAGAADMDLAVTSVGTLIVNSLGVAGNSLDTLVTSAVGTLTLNASGGPLSTGAITGNSSLGAINIAADAGTVTTGAIGGISTQLAVNISGSKAVTIASVADSGNVGQNTVITSTSSAGTTITAQLDDDSQFTGSAETGSAADNLTFGANTRTNTLGAGDDTVFINAPLNGTVVGSAGFGSIDGGTNTSNPAQFAAGGDVYNVTNANLAAMTASTTNAHLSNFEVGHVTGGGAAGVTDTIDIAKAGLAATTYIISDGASSTTTQEVTTITFSGTATGMVQGSTATVNTADVMTFDGVPTVFDDNAGAVAQAADFTATYNAVALGSRNWTAVDNLNGTVTLTKNVGGTATDLTSANFVFTDAQNIGAPAGTVSNVVDGVNTVAAAKEIAQMTFNNVAVANGETITVSDNTLSFTFTNTSGATLLGSNGSTIPANNQLANAFVAAFNNAANPLFFPTSAVSYTASVVSGNVVFTADLVGAKPDLFINGPGSTGLIAPADDYSMVTPGSVGSPAGTQQGVTAVAGSKETFDYLVTVAGNANDTVTFNGTTKTFDGSENTTALAAAKIAGVYANWTATVDVVQNNLLHFTQNANGNVTNVTNASFVIVDDTNVGTPAVSVAAPAIQGDVGGLVFNNFSNAGTLQTNGNGTHTVNLATQTAADSLNLFLNGGRTNTVNAPGVETVNVSTDNDGVTSTDTLTLNDTSLQSIVITGNDNFNLTTNAPGTITNVNESGNSGFFTWTSGALTNAVTVSTGSGGSNINMLAATQAITFNGGSGGDTLVLGNANSTTVNLGAGNDTVTTGTGLTNSISVGADHDTINVTQTLNGNSYSKVSDYTAASVTAGGGSGDSIHFNVGADGILGAFNAVQVPTLQPTASFQDYLDAAAAGGPGTIRWFQFTSGVGANNNTYVVDDNSGATTFQNGVDNVIELSGLINLSTSLGGAGNTGNVFVA